MKVAGGIIGLRGTEHGIFIAPPGIDAETAAAEQLMLHLTAATAQSAIIGVATPAFPRVVPHLLGYPPIVFPNLISTDIVAGFGYVRPFDNSWGPWTHSNIEVGSSAITINQSYVDAAPALNVYYTVFNQRAPA